MYLPMYAFCIYYQKCLMANAQKAHIFYAFDKPFVPVGNALLLPYIVCRYDAGKTSREIGCVCEGSSTLHAFSRHDIYVALCVRWFPFRSFSAHYITWCSRSFQCKTVTPAVCQHRFFQKKSTGERNSKIGRNGESRECWSVREAARLRHVYSFHTV